VKALKEMAKLNEPYRSIVVESYRESGSGLHGGVHIRPIPAEGFSPGIRVECAKQLSRDYPVGTKFRIQAKLTDRENGGEFLYSYFRWKVEVLP
jgi:hypothetical protein